MGNKVTSLDYEKRLRWSVEQKIDHAFGVIDKFYNHCNGKVYVAFSGGKDSTVLLYLVRKLFPNVEAVFCDTGLEYPEIRDFVKTVGNVKWIKPKMPFKKVIEKYGYPVISKEQSKKICDFRTTKSEKYKNILWNGKKLRNNSYGFGISKRWRYLINAPFKISEKCCDKLKMQPIRTYEKKSGNYSSFVGTMASEGRLRKNNYLKYGCIVFLKNRQLANPLSIFTDKDIWQIIKKYKLPYSKIYETGVRRTGCMFCMFGVHLESPNRFQMMAETHPKQYKYCMEHLGIRKVLQYLGLEWKPQKQLKLF